MQAFYEIRSSYGCLVAVAGVHRNLLLLSVSIFCYKYHMSYIVFILTQFGSMARNIPYSFISFFIIVLFDRYNDRPLAFKLSINCQSLITKNGGSHKLCYQRGAAQRAVPGNSKESPSEPAVQAGNYVVNMLDSHYFHHLSCYNAASELETI